MSLLTCPVFLPNVFSDLPCLPQAWMCGGSVEIIPCSHVGHMFRYTAPYSWGPDKDVLTKNCLRVAQVWMDDYTIFYFDRLFYTHVSTSMFGANPFGETM